MGRVQMICGPCAEEADGLRPPNVAHIKVTCSGCGKTVLTTKYGKLRKHGTCSDNKYATWGHDACMGCTCMHRPKGAWKGDK